MTSSAGALKDRISILVVDNDPSVGKRLKQILTQDGFDVDCVQRAEDALIKLSQIELPHLLLTDIHLPGLTGLELIQKVRNSISDEIQCLLLTGPATVDAAIDGIRLGAYDYLLKPLEDEMKVRAVMERAVKHLRLLQMNHALLELQKEKTRDFRSVTGGLKESEERLQKLNDLQLELVSKTQMAEVLETGLRGISTLIRPCPTVFFQFLDRTRQLSAKAFLHVEERSAVRLSFPLQSNRVEDIRRELDGFVENARFLETLRTNFGMKNPFVVSVGSSTQTLGLLAIDFAPPLSSLEQMVLQPFVRFFGMALCNLSNHQRVLELATRDGLTDLLTIRSFRERLQEEMGRAYRLKHPLCLLFLDIDFFKMYNDAHGHLAGDKVLRQLGQLIRSHFRTQDLLGRYGGEEFVIAMTHTPLDLALKKAESLRRLVEGFSFQHSETQPEGHLTVSIGVSCYPTLANGADELFSTADNALYKAKAEGRNRIKSAAAETHHVPSFLPSA